MIVDISIMYKIKTFHIALKYCLDKKGFGAQSNLARKIGKSQQFISALLAGKSDGLEETRRAIAEVCGYSYEDFLSLGEALSNGGIISESRSVYEPESLLTRFKNRDLAKRYILMLAKIESLDAGSFVSIENYLQGMIDAITVLKKRENRI